MHFCLLSRRQGYPTPLPTAFSCRGWILVEVELGSCVCEPGVRVSPAQCITYGTLWHMAHPDPSSVHRSASLTIHGSGDLDAQWTALPDPSSVHRSVSLTIHGSGDLDSIKLIRPSMNECWSYCSGGFLWVARTKKKTQIYLVFIAELL